jgi:hypothetical protein
VNDKNIGIKLADGSFYSVLEQGFEGQKKLVVTTVRDNQDTVQIDLYQSEAAETEGADYLGSLIIENIQALPKGEPEIEVIVGLDDEGNLNAAASDRFTGERQSLSVSLQSLEEESHYEVPDFDIEEEMAPDLGPEEEPQEDLLTGETYPIGPGDRRKEHLARRKRNPLLLAAFVLLCLILIAAVAFLIYRGLNGSPIPPLEGGGVAAAAAAGEAPAAAPAPEAPAAEAPAAEAPPPEAPPPEAPAPEAPAPAPQKASGGLWHDIKKGDTLWDISATYYRNPWLYPRIARENHIADPDFILAGKKLYIPEN